MSEESTEATTLPPETTLGRVSIRVADLDRVLPFYREAIGCRVERVGPTARLSAADGGELLVLEEDPDAAPRPRSAARLFHVAIRLPDRPSLGATLGRLRAAGATLSGASDHLVSEALYLRDPAGNGLELYCDRPRETWSRLEDGRVEMDTLPLDLDDLAAAAPGTEASELPAGTDVGHVHLEVTDLAAATAFYADALGFRRSTRSFQGASFLAAGDYHHHVGLNVWNRRTDPAGDHQGVEWFELRLPDEASREAALDRLTVAGVEVAVRGDVPAVDDPDHVRIRVVVGHPRVRP